MENKKCYIYGLVNPRNEIIRYVGKTVNLTHRFNHHIKYDRSDCHKSRWISLLSSLKLKPLFIILEQVELFSWQERERFWISYLNKKGNNLTNETPGGDGREKGFKHKPSSIKKIVEALKRRSPELRRQAGIKSSAKQKGKILSEEHRNNLIKSHLSMWRALSEEKKKKFMRGLRRKWTEHDKAVQSAQRTGKKRGMGTSRYLGVSWFKRDSCWRAWMKQGRKQKHLGYFQSEEEAAHAYDEAAKKYHGEFAHLNFKN